MSAQIIDISTHRVARIGAPRTLRSDVDREVRGYCELLGLSPQQTGLCVAVALQRFANGGAPKNAAAAGKDRADRIFRASPTPPPGPRAA